MTSRLAPRTTREPRPSRVPIARSECPETRGATKGANAARSVDRSTSMYTSTGASEVDHTACSARPRPFSGTRTTRTSSGRRPVRQRCAGCSSTLALSAMVMRAENGNCSSKMAMKPLHRVGQCGLLVVHRHHDVEHGHARLTGGHRGVRSRFESNLGRGATSSAVSVMASSSRRSLCCPLAQAV